jgi:tRNA A37 threonylcarbamoyladenosine biosynthesis protein TsaE
MNVYLTTHPDIRQIVHLDFYRLKSAGEVAQLGLEEWLGRADAVVVVEWPDAVEGLVWDGAKRIRFSAPSPDERTIDVSA